MSTLFPPPPKSNLAKYFGFSLVGGLAVVYGYWKYITWHNYPPEVANKLRLGLYAEGSAGGLDYKTALMRYLEALEEADKSGLSALSDEYTGLQLKVAEMYEKLEMNDEARLVYRELGTAYIQELAENNLMPEHLRSHLIQRDLRVALKTAYLECATNPQMAKMGLLVHVMLAQEEVAKRCPELRELIKKGKRFQKDSSLDENAYKESLARQRNAWQPFRDELFSARDLYVSLCIATGDIGLAIRTKQATTAWMATSGIDVSEQLMSMYNVGAMFYLQSEQLEVLDYQDKQSGGSRTPKELAAISMNHADTCFTKILKHIERLPNKLRSTGDIYEVHALATYGLGVIALHKGDFGNASELLREARLRAKGCGYEDLILNTEQELQKLEKMKNDGNTYAPVPPLLSLKK